MFAVPVGGNQLFWRQYHVYQSVFDGLIGIDVIIAVPVALNNLSGLTCAFHQNLVQAFALPTDLFGLNENVGGLTLRAAQWLMHVDSCVGHSVAPALVACC